MKKILSSFVVVLALSGCGGGGGGDGSSASSPIIPFPKALSGMPQYTVMLQNNQYVGDFVKNDFPVFARPEVDALHNALLIGQDQTITASGCTGTVSSNPRFLSPYISISCENNTFEVSYTDNKLAYRAKEYVKVSGRVVFTFSLYVPTTTPEQPEYTVTQYDNRGNVSASTTHYYRWNGKSYDYLGYI